MSQIIGISNQFKEVRSRREVAAQEQIRIFRKAMIAIKGELQVPQSRGKLSAVEQMRILQQSIGRQNVLLLSLVENQGEWIE